MAFRHKLRSFFWSFSLLTGRCYEAGKCHIILLTSTVAILLPVWSIFSTFFSIFAKPSAFDDRSFMSTNSSLKLRHDSPKSTLGGGEGVRV